MVHLLVFIDSRFGTVSRRVRNQARRFGGFSSVSILDETDLEPEFRVRHKSVLEPEVKGYGYWCWKPQVIAQRLATLPEGEILVYMDAGSHLNPRGRKMWKKYISICRSSVTGVLAFQTDLLEKNWTKSDVFHYFNVIHRPEILERGQVGGGLIFIQNSAFAREFVEQWQTIIDEHFRLVDDSPSRHPNLSGFMKHRHDQSVFSVLGKVNQIELLPASGLERPRGQLTWLGTGSFPVHHRRDLPGHPSKGSRVKLQELLRGVDKLVRATRRIGQKGRSRLEPFN